MFAATLTSVAVFAPMIFITGIAGQLFKDQSLTVAFALSFSLLVALTLVPMLAAGRARAAAAEAAAHAEPKPLGPRWTRTAHRARRLRARRRMDLERLQARAEPARQRRRRPSTAGPTASTRAPSPGRSRNPGKVIGSAVAVFVLTMVLILPRLGTELIPQMSQGEFNVDLRLPPGTPLEQTDRSVQAAQRASDCARQRRPRLQRRGHGQPARRQPGRRRREHRPPEHHVAGRRGPRGRRNGDGRHAQGPRADAGPAVPLQPPCALQHGDAARSRRLRLRPRPARRGRRVACARRCSRMAASPTSRRRSRPAIPKSRSCSTRNARRS